MSGLRSAAVSGLFYPSSPHELRSVVRSYLEQDEPASGGPAGDAYALIAPHAGYAYSGPIAGSSFRRAQR